MRDASQELENESNGTELPKMTRLGCRCLDSRETRYLELARSLNERRWMRLEVEMEVLGVRHGDRELEGAVMTFDCQRVNLA